MLNHADSVLKHVNMLNHADSVLKHVRNMLVTCYIMLTITFHFCLNVFVRIRVFSGFSLILSEENIILTAKIVYLSESS